MQQPSNICLSKNNFNSIPYGTVNDTKYKITGTINNAIVMPYTQQSETKIITPKSYQNNKILNIVNILL